MTIINCPECGHRVSNQAITCPNCAYPISTVPPKQSGVGASTEQTIELTSKHFKLHTIYSSLTIVVSAIIIVMSGGNSYVLTFGGLTCGIGLIWLISSRARIWWHHK